METEGTVTPEMAEAWLPSARAIVLKKKEAARIRQRPSQRRERAVATAERFVARLEAIIRAANDAG